KLAPHAASVRGEVVGHRLVRGLEVDRSVGLAVVREVGGKDTPIADVLAVPKLLLVDDRESIAGANIEREVDVPTEDVVRECQDDFRAHPGGSRGEDRKSVV